jgi:hypothetical protein
MVYGGVIAVVDLFLLMRFGVLSLVAYLYTSMVLRILPVTSDLSVWYAQHMFLALAVVAVFDIYSFRVTMAGRRLWKDEL